MIDSAGLRDMFARIAEAMEERKEWLCELDGVIGDGYCWCGKTQNVLGPDDALVGRLRCNNGRNCYVASL